MLPTELLVTRKYGGRIWPLYAKTDADYMELASSMIQAYECSIGKQKKELNKQTSEMENLGFDYRLIRGLTKVLDRHLDTVLHAKIDPEYARRTLFTESGKTGIPDRPEQRTAIVSRVAAKIGLDEKDLEEALYADLEEEQIIESFTPTSPADLLRAYNLSLTQTLLFSATEITFTISGNWQRIFRQINWLQLMYTATRDSRQINVKIDGPASLFKLNKRYGTALARLLPDIVSTESWSLQAKILQTRRSHRLYAFEMNSNTHSRLVGPKDHVDEVSFDSGVEESFHKSFSTLRSGWTLSRQVEPIPVGQQVMIPDFVFEKAGTRVYMEIVGFWTPDYLQEKMQKLDKIRGVEMIVAADTSLFGGRTARVPKALNAVYFRKKIPLKPVMSILKTKEKKLIDQQIDDGRDTEIRIDQPVVDVEEMSSRLNLNPEFVQAILDQQVTTDHVRIGSLIVQREIVEEIKLALQKRIDSDDPLTLTEATDLIEKKGIHRPILILNALGYNVKWHGINPDKALVTSNVVKNTRDRLR